MLLVDGSAGRAKENIFRKNDYRLLHRIAPIKRTLGNEHRRAKGFHRERIGRKRVNCGSSARRRAKPPHRRTRLFQLISERANESSSMEVNRSTPIKSENQSLQENIRMMSAWNDAL